MNLLLDTHTFIWWYDEQHKLSPPALAEISRPANTVFLSVASLWELQIKISLGRFKFADPLETVVHEQITTNGILLLPVAFPHVLALDNLPSHHKDPFDRLLIAQAIAENLTLASADRKFSAYTVNLLW